ncbi:transcriptional coactivator PipX [Geminocystis sp. NIES-3709]|uniref:transcriptional coactivator PipX n=1 Tax=Geminocystis sp. NIES-3709 TaxID=1617448 RepID=UPI000AFA741B|nr:PipX family protein [Geminocystis sp. NIES-3709]
MSTEIYINHPNFGLLYRLCIVEKNEELFTTLYAQRLFFKVIIQPQETIFEPLSRTEARLLIEGKLRRLRSNGEWETYKQVNQLYQRTFQ